MVIDLEKSVSISEYASITVSGIKKEEIIEANPNVIASGIFGFVCSSLIYKLRREKNIEVPELFNEIDKSFIKKLKR